MVVGAGYVPGVDRGARRTIGLGVVEGVRDGRSVGLVPCRRLGEDAHRVDVEEAVARRRGVADLARGGWPQLGKLARGRARAVGEPGEPCHALREDGVGPEAVAELVAGAHPDVQVGVVEAAAIVPGVGRAECWARGSSGAGFLGSPRRRPAISALRSLSLGVVGAGPRRGRWSCCRSRRCRASRQGDLHVDVTEPGVVRDDEVGAPRSPE